MVVPFCVNFQQKMEQRTFIKYVNLQLNIGLANWNEAWDLSGKFPEKLFTEVYTGNLVFRKRGSFMRTSYRRIKEGLIKKTIPIMEEPLPF